MVSWLMKMVAPVAALALGASVTGCSYSAGWNNEVSGVPLAELDLAGDPPSRIVLAGPDEVVISDGEGLTISLAGSEAAGEAMRFDRDGDTLTIARDSDVYDGREKAVVQITIPAPSAIEIMGSGEIRADLLAQDSSVEIAGSGDIVIERVDSASLDVEIAGSGSVTASGQADRVTIEIAGSGDVRFAQLEAGDARIEIAGSGDVELVSNGSVNGEIAGAGDIIVTGTASCSVETAGAGSVTCRPAPVATSEGDTPTQDGAASAE